jgi:hypothetical protein
LEQNSKDAFVGASWAQRFIKGIKGIFHYSQWLSFACSSSVISISMGGIDSEFFCDFEQN